MSAGVAIRAEGPADAWSVDEVILRAFGRREEVDLVRALRDCAHERVSLVANRGGRVVGHVLFTGVTVEGPSPPTRAVALAPLAVHPDQQRMGIGGLLVRAGLAACAAGGAPFAVVLGHRSYYPRFGFTRADEKGLRYGARGSEDSFFAIELQRGGLAGASGVVRQAPPFDSV